MTTHLRLAFLYTGRLIPVSFVLQGADGPLKFPGYPFMHMPRSTDSGGILSVCHSTLRIHAFQSNQTVGFPRHHNGLSMLSLWTTNIQFSELSNAAYALTTPGFIHTLLDMHAGSLQVRWLFSPDGTWAVLRPHPLGNYNSFHGLRSDPKALDLT